MERILDDYSALARMKLIEPQAGYVEKYNNKSQNVCYINNIPCRHADDIINDLLKTDIWLGVEAIANMRAKFNREPRIRRENRKIFNSVRKDIDEWFEY